MPNRYIRENAIESEPVNSLTWQGEVFYRRLLNRVDDFGRYTAHSALLRASIFPLQLDKVRDSDIPRLLAECEKAGLLFVYTADSSKQVLIMNKWEKGRAHKSEYPEPPANICLQMQTFVYRGKHKFTNVPDSDSDTDSDTDAGVRPTPISKLSDSEWLITLRTNPAYQGIDIDRERGKCIAHFALKNITPSRRRFLAWLNRAEKPMQTGYRAGEAPKRVLREIHGWKVFMNHTYPDSIYSANGSHEAHSWGQLPDDVQLKITKEMQTQ
jgi:hypothetical protein